MSKFKFNRKENFAAALVLVAFALVIYFWDEIKHFIAGTFFA